MSECERVLLERFVSHGDAGAFSEIVRRHAGLVYGTCMRVLADADKAADATQETFFQLVKKADRVTESIPGWLHRVAVRQATDRIRTDSRRRRRERAYVAGKDGADPTWQEICPYVDEALSQLDPGTQEVLVRHYMEGLSLTALAEQFGVSRATVHRRADAGLKKLRAQLRKQGIAVAVGALGAFLAENAAQSAPAPLVQQLGKMALVGGQVAATSTAAATGTSVVIAAVKANLIPAAVIAVVAGTALILFGGGSETSSTGPITPSTSGQSRIVQLKTAARDRSPQPAQVSVAAEPVVEPPSVSEDNTSPPAPVDVEEPEVTWSIPSADLPAEAPKEDRLDLSSPEATARSFVRAIVAGDTDAVMACFLPGGEDYGDMLEMMHANGDNPNQRSDYEARCLFRALDPDAEMPMLSMEETERGTSVRWQVTFKDAFTIEGHTFNAGDTMDFDGTMCQSGDDWLIVSL